MKEVELEKELYDNVQLSKTIRTGNKHLPKN
jgi:hypothetical protein